MRAFRPSAGDRHQAPVVTGDPGDLPPHRLLHRRPNPDLRNLTGTQSRLTGHRTWTTGQVPAIRPHQPPTARELTVHSDQRSDGLSTYALMSVGDGDLIKAVLLNAGVRRRGRGLGVLEWWAGLSTLSFLRNPERGRHRWPRVADELYPPYV